MSWKLSFADGGEATLSDVDFSELLVTFGYSKYDKPMYVKHMFTLGDTSVTAVKEADDVT